MPFKCLLPISSWTNQLYYLFKGLPDANLVTLPPSPKVAALHCYHVRETLTSLLAAMFIKIVQLHSTPCLPWKVPYILISQIHYILQYYYLDILVSICISLVWSSALIFYTFILLRRQIQLIPCYLMLYHLQYTSILPMKLIDTNIHRYHCLPNFAENIIHCTQTY